MYMQSKEESARRERNGLDSHILLQRECLPDVSLPATWVDVLSWGRGGGSKITLLSRST